MFYVALRCAIKIVAEGSGLELDPRAAQFLATWETGPYGTIGTTKQNLLAFYEPMDDVPLSPTFEHLRPWLRGMQLVFSLGIAKVEYLKRQLWSPDAVQPMEHRQAFDEYETMHGEVTLRNFLARFDSIEKLVPAGTK